MVHVAGLALALSASVPGTARATQARLGPSATRVVLPNGLTVLLAPDSEVPVVGLELCYRVGSRDDPEGRPGLAALVHRLMVRATTHVGEGEYDRRLDAAGVANSRWTTELDRTYFRLTVPADELALPLWLWSDQMGFLVGGLDQRLIDQQIATLQNEYVQRIENAPGGRVAGMTTAALYPPEHPYHRGAWRAAESLRGITVADLRAFVESHYTPDRATLVLTGDFDTRHALALVEKYFGTLRNGPPAPRRTGSRPILPGEVRLHVAARVELPSVTIAWSTPGIWQPGDPELDLIAQLLAGPRAGFLRFKLVDQLKIATAVSANQYSRDLGSEFVIHATAARGHTPAELIAAIDDVVLGLSARPANAYYLNASVTGYLVDKLFAVEDHAARASLYARCEERGILGHCLEAWLQRYTSLTTGQLSTTIGRELPPDRRVIVEVVPTADAPIAGELRAGTP
jgi:zinc protease